MKGSIYHMKIFETLVGICMLASVIVLLYLLVVSTSSAQVRLNAERNFQIQSRVAYNYVLARFHQADIAGNISLQSNPLDPGRNALVIHEQGKEGRYDTWIYSDDNTLYECLTEPNQAPNHELSFVIANSVVLNVEGEDSIFSWSVTNLSTEDVGLSGLFTMRAGGGFDDK